MINLILILIILGIIAVNRILPSYCSEYSECVFGVITYNIYAATEFILTVTAALLVYRIGRRILNK